MSTEAQVVEGRFASARVFANVVEGEALAQIQRFLDSPAFAGTRVSIMPDVHAGIGAVIGFTATLCDKVIPNVIGVDIGCGVMAWKLGSHSHLGLDFAKLDEFIREEIPCGRDVRARAPVPAECEGLDENYLALREDVVAACAATKQESSYVLRSLGTLGGGNHFVEVDRDEDGGLWLAVHSGSRNFGLRVAQWHQQKARNLCGNLHGLEYLEGEDARTYLAHMQVAQRYAALNRRLMGRAIVERFVKRRVLDCVESVHNYIDFGDGIIRKGAIAARRGQRVVIPWNMRDGMILGVGLGNEEWNSSAPHGAGRKMGRRAAKESLSLEEFRKTMKDVWSSCISEATLDESPMAYKNAKDISEELTPTVEVISRLSPVYNFKASE